MKRRIISMLLVVAMAVSVLAGCGNKEQSGGNSNGGNVSGEADNLEESREISVWLYKDDYKYYESYNENPIVAYINEKFNCTLDFQQPAMGSEQEQFSLMLGTGSYTDIMEISYSTEGVSTLYDDGVIVDLAPYLEKYAPNLYAFLNDPENEDVKKALYDEKGHFFTIPTQLNVDEPLLWGGLVYRQDILKTMTGGFVAFPSGNEAPTTVEDWEYMLELYNQYFTMAGFPNYAGLILPYMGYFQTGEILNGFGAAPNFYIAEDGTVKFGPTEENFYNYLVKMNEWYEKGYIYTDFASRSNDVFYLPNTDLTYGGAAGIWYGLSSQLGDAMSMPEYGLEVMVDSVAAPVDTANVDTALSYLGGDSDRAMMNNNGYVVSATCSEENLIRWLSICDYLFTEEGMMIRSYGLTAEQEAAENAMYQQLGLTDGTYSVEGEARFAYHEKMVPNVGEISLNQATNSVLGTRLPGLRLNKYDNALSAEEAIEASAVWRTYGKESNYPGAIVFDADDNNTVSSNYTAYNDYMNTMIPKFIMGTEELNEETWNAYVEQLNALGAAENLEIYQSYYEAYMEK